MWLYLIIFFIPVIFYFRTGQGTNKQVSFLMVFLLVLAFFVGMSDMFGGYDRYIYGEVFDTIADVTTIKGSYIKSDMFSYFDGEVGYTWLNIIISFITENRYIFILIVTLIIYSCLFVSLKRYAENYPMALVLFLGLWFFFSFTYLRQVLGATIAWLGVKYVIERNFWKFCLVSFIAFSMHNSALIFFPLYFIPIKKFPPSLVVGVMLVLFGIGLSPIPNALFEIYASSTIEERNSEYNASGGLRIPYILEAFFFLYLILKNYGSIPKEKSYIVLMNMSLVFCAVLLFFVRSENGGRLSWYYMLGVITTISYICTFHKNIVSKIPIFLIGLSLFLYLRIYTGWQRYLNLYPYKTFFSNGYREKDYSWERYEYDHEYDRDKFYRTAFRFCPNFKK